MGTENLKYHTILFDLDGTLTDSQEGITKCVHYALQHFGIEETDYEKLKLFIGPPLDDMFMEIYGFSKEKAVEARMKYRERFQTVGMYENSPYEGIIPMLAKLQKKGVKLAVATSKPEHFSRKILDRFEMTQYFDAISGADLDGNHVSKPDMIREAMRRLGKAVEDTKGVLMIGDRKFDVEGAHECGMPCVGVRFGFAKPNELEQAGAEYIVETVEELDNLLNTICEKES